MTLHAKSSTGTRRKSVMLQSRAREEAGKCRSGHRSDITLHKHWLTSSQWHPVYREPWHPRYLTVL